MSNDGILKVQYSGLSHTAAEIRAASSLLDSQLQAIWASVEKVTHGWQGEAQQMMHAASKQWHARAEHIHAVLKDVAEKIEHGSTQYQATDRKAAGYFHGG
ncbi:MULTISPECIES: WXG100 family type VII secretion target [Streptomyces]|uniref:ESAT-6-like protein n=1 Tax=Streptomyces luteosporeus TaxID=173856 RepID=A0ABN3U6S1_9ACTN